MFQKEAIKLVVLGAIIGAISSSGLSFLLEKGSPSDLAKDETLLASAPLRSINRPTSVPEKPSSKIQTAPKPTQKPPQTSPALLAQAISSFDNSLGVFQQDLPKLETETKTPQAQETAKSSCRFSQGGSPSQSQLVFNEINWAGSEANSNHEWIELKNISSKELDISLWSIVDQKEQIQFLIPENTVLPSSALYLIKRGEDTLVNIPAPIYTGALSNSSEGLKLFSSSCSLQDEALADPNWPAGDPKNRLTMERASDLSWHSSATSGGSPAESNSSPPKEIAEEKTESTQNSGSGVFVPQTTSPEQQPQQTSQPDPDPEPEPEPDPEPQNEIPSGCESGQIDINSASLEELDQIKGVGPSIGQKIIDARPFNSLDELDDKVSGIGESRLSDIITEGKACVQ